MDGEARQLPPEPGEAEEAILRSAGMWPPDMQGYVTDPLSQEKRHWTRALALACREGIALTDRVRVHLGDVLAMLRELRDASVHCVVTSPPYLDARDYGVPPTAWPAVTYRPRFDLEPVTVPATVCCLGHEKTLVAYVGHLVLVARELARVLRRDGTFWLNLAPTYSAGTTAPRKPTTTQGDSVPSSWASRCMAPRVTAGLAAKQRIPVPSAVCDALQAEGWIVRNAIAWVKPNATPSSARDRCTPAHEAVFLLARSRRYRVHLDRLATPAQHPRSRNTGRTYGKARGDAGSRRGASVPWEGDTAHPRDVWNIPTARFRGAHFATFPVELARRCVLAGSDVGDLVLDPFGGSGTTAEAAVELGREALLCELNADYVAMQRERLEASSVRRAQGQRTTTRVRHAPDGSDPEQLLLDLGAAT